MQKIFSKKFEIFLSKKILKYNLKSIKPNKKKAAAAAAAAFRAGGDKGVQPSRSLWVGSLTQDTTETDLRREFSVYGMIESIKVIIFFLYSQKKSAKIMKKN